ncbi:hypothetical protein AWC38_SpisGene10704 [Stylophora pistillata]|uniref:Protein CUSTOS n=1 Tax=Stylophora pistillata TaxID=50429 RepID=A0A2B4S7B6_STYPI|nr:hypothetical protein AWC38_SpisGene10704 [Stylophora pistillata]
MFSMASCESSEDEDLAKFAVITNVVDTEVAMIKGNGTSLPNSKSKLSLRHWRKEEDIACSSSELITPEFRHHVAKKISKFLDENFICSEKNTGLQDDLVSSSHEPLGIKLLSKSNQLLLGESAKEVPSSTVARKNTKFSVSSESDTDEEELSRLAEAAVSGHSVIQEGPGGGEEKAEDEAKTERKRKKEKKRSKEKRKKSKVGEELKEKKHKKHKKEKHKDKT